MDCYRETVSGTERWVFRARSHDCQFKGVLSIWYQERSFLTLFAQSLYHLFPPARNTYKMEVGVPLITRHITSSSASSSDDVSDGEVEDILCTC
jgi:hypothetical protein